MPLYSFPSARARFGFNYSWYHYRGHSRAYRSYTEDCGEFFQLERYARSSRSWTFSTSTLSTSVDENQVMNAYAARLLRVYRKHQVRNSPKKALAGREADHFAWRTTTSGSELARRMTVASTASWSTLLKPPSPFASALLTPAAPQHVLRTLPRSKALLREGARRCVHPSQALRLFRRGRPTCSALEFQDR